MLLASALAFLLFGPSGLIHYLLMSRSHERIMRSRLSRGSRLIDSIYAGRQMQRPGGSRRRDGPCEEVRPRTGFFDTGRVVAGELRVT